MAVSANSYTTIARIEARISDLIVDGAFTPTTRPTLAQAETFIDDVASNQNALLQAMGYTAPIVEADDPFAFEATRTANTAGACVMVMNVFPIAAYNPDNPDPLRNRISGYIKEWDLWVEAVEGNKLVAARRTTKTGLFMVGSARDRESGELKLPTFRRDMLDYPGRKPGRSDGTQ
jgi:hypothetical protein